MKTESSHTYKSHLLAEAENSGPIGLPTVTLILMGFLLALLATSMVLIPQIWFFRISDLSDLRPTTVTEIWMYKSITYCNEPWQQTDLTLQKYFEQKGITLIDYKYLASKDGSNVTCTACNCYSGDDLYVLVNKKDQSQLLNLSFIVYNENSKK